ncbi:porin [Paraburkholderia sp. RL17-347-BIC-D]|uniref:porin n=1 Tax=Paraburkholderia sp. RL17-347-BIC-D TaxID=3031632 RepID=UPI0038B9A068
MMRGRVAAFGLGMLSASAFAQSSVTLYGLIDTGIEYVSHANSAGDHVVRMPAISGELPSRWGIRGTEDLGGGWKAIFTLENGFNTRAGDIGQGGRLFGRQAWVGIDGPWGALTFGRQYNMVYWALSDADMLGPDVHGIGALDNYLPNARSDNSIVYKGTYKGVTVGASYSFGRDAAGTGNSPGQGTCAGQVPGQFNPCHEWSAMLKYDAASFGVATAYDEQRGGANAAANFFDGIGTFPIASGADKDTRIVANGYVKFAGLKVGAGWLGRHVETNAAAAPDVRSNLYFVGAQYFVTPSFVIDGEGFRIVVREQDARATMTTLRATYFLSKATAVYIGGTYLWNSAKARFSASVGGGGTTPAAGMGQFATMAGIRHLF